MNDEEFEEVTTKFDELILNDMTDNQVRALYAIANNVFLDAQKKDNLRRKRYYLRYDVPPLFRTARTKPSYFVISRIDGSPDMSYSQMEYEGFQKIFTESEIAQMDITGFQKVEVEG